MNTKATIEMFTKYMIYTGLFHLYSEMKIRSIVYNDYRIIETASGNLYVSKHSLSKDPIYRKYRLTYKVTKIPVIIHKTHQMIVTNSDGNCVICVPTDFGMRWRKIRELP